MASKLHASGLRCHRSAPTAARCALFAVERMLAHIVLQPTAQDRVEASPEQMVRCAAQAEECSKQRGVRIRVIGWYHSHPHITVLPSHVDVRTQATYQQLDEGFVGLIFSTFNEDSLTLAQRVQVPRGAFVSPNRSTSMHVNHRSQPFNRYRPAAVAPLPVWGMTTTLR